MYEDHSVTEQGTIEKMMDINGGKKVIPTIVINNQIVLGFDRNRLKEMLGVQ